jgi:nucleoside-diphosphate-sugar epimerase
VTGRVLVVGGTGPTGPDVVRLLLDRGADVTVLHRGLHEPDARHEPEGLPDVPHLHADPHFADHLRAALGDRSFDTVVATYGRMRVLAEVFAGRCERFVAVGGNPVHAGHLNRHATFPTGMRLLAGEDSPRARPGAGDRDRFATRVREAEEAVLAAGARGAFAATYLRYPMVYGRRSMLGFERGLLARVRAGRRRILLPDGGLSVYSRLADRNAAHLVGLVLDAPEVTAGRVYQCADDEQFSTLQWAQLAVAALGGSVEFVGLPVELSRCAWDLLPTGPDGSAHTLVDTTRARRELGYADVVAPRAVLAEVMAALADDPGSTAAVDWDPAGEDAALAGRDELLARLRDGTTPATAGRRWHPYAHPTEPLPPG